MARRADYNEHQAAKRLRVPLAVFRWARHVSLVPAPDASPGTWSRAAVEEMDAHAVRAAMPHAAVTAVTAANRIAQALGTPRELAAADARDAPDAGTGPRGGAEAGDGPGL
ncbi:hypothetical protein ABT329_42480, partial [Streptomyces minutiscleroticus]